MSWPAEYHPWLHMEPRNVPLLAQHEHSFTSIVAQFRGENGRGYKITDDVYHFPCSEQRKRESDIIGDADALLSPSRATTTRCRTPAAPASARP